MLFSDYPIGLRYVVRIGVIIFMMIYMIAPLDLKRERKNCEGE